MKLVAILAGIGLSASVAWGHAELTQSDEFQTQLTTIRPCSSWRSAGTGGYTCSFYNSLRVADAYDIQTLQSHIRQLENKVRLLEQKINEL